MNLSAIYSKTGKGVQEASGKTSRLSRADRAVLSAIDGKTPLTEVQTKFEKLTAPKFEALIEQLDKDGYIREVSTGASQPSAPLGRTAPRGAPPPKAPAPSGDDDEVLDFTQAIKPSMGPAAAPKGPNLDLAAASRAESERREKEREAFDYKAREETEARAKAEAEAKARAAAAEARARVAAEEKARAEAEAKARAEADAKVKAAREAAIRLATEAKAKGEAAEQRARNEAEEKARLEAELNAKLAEERKAREEAERRAQEAAERTRRELEEKAKRDAEEMRQRLEAEMKAKLEEERKAREAEDRKRREEEERKRREEDERRRKEEQERRAKEEAERKAREAEDRKRREEEDRKRREEDERRRKEDEERRAKEEAERRAKEEAERRARREEEERRAKEDAERRKRDEAERKAKEEAERKAKDEAERREKVERAEAKARAAQLASLPAVEPAAPAAAPAATAPSSGGDIDDSLLADLDSFSVREEEETRAKEEADRKAKEKAARRAKDEAAHKAKEEADRKRREDEDRRRKEEEARREREEAEREEREAEERRKEEEEAERKRQANEAEAMGAAQGDYGIEVTDEDLDMDDIKREQRVLATAARMTEREFEPPPPAAVSVARRPKKWGKPAAIALFLLLIGGVGLLNVMPVSTADYEKAASEAIGAPVKIGSARLSVLAGVQVKFENVSIGDDVKIRLVRGSPEIGSLFGGKKAFSRIELEGASISQAQLGGAVFGKVSGDNFRVGRIVMKQAKFEGPLVLPALDVEAIASGDGSLQSVSMQGGDKLSVQISTKGSEADFEISAASFALPFVPALTLLEFGMKGTANRGGVTASEFDGRLFDGVVSGKAKIRWGANWNVDGELRARTLKAAVFAPALVSEGRLEADGTYSMSGPVPASLFESARVQGNFKIEKGVLGSFDLTRALTTGGAQTSGSTPFSELTGQALYDKGTLQLRNIAITAGGMKAGASLDIDAGGGLAGRVVADVKTPTQSLRATLNISGKVQDPVIRK